MTECPAALTLGFLTVLHDATGYLGGYLVTNAWGRPLEFRLTTAVQPNRVQQILYGATLGEYIHADLIGKALVEKTSVAPALILTDTPGLLALRPKVECPVIVLGPAILPASCTLIHARAQGPVLFSPESDRERINELLNQTDQAIDLAEPFARIREAIAEARKMGVATRGAA